MPGLKRFLRFLFHHLYHTFAWAYDLVSGAVSLGHWNDWMLAVIPLLRAGRVLELGHGPGHLQQRLLRDPNLIVFGLDESSQMGRLAGARLRRGGRRELSLARGLAQYLPFPAESFECIVSTFPSEYIFDRRTLAEARRTLINGGRLIVLPVARPGNRLLAWLFRVTGQSPSGVIELAKANLGRPFIESGFEVDVQKHDVQSGTLLLIIANKRAR